MQPLYVGVQIRDNDTGKAWHLAQQLAPALVVTHSGAHGHLPVPAQAIVSGGITWLNTLQDANGYWFVFAVRQPAGQRGSR